MVFLLPGIVLLTLGVLCIIAGMPRLTGYLVTSVIFILYVGFILNKTLDKTNKERLKKPFYRDSDFLVVFLFIVLIISLRFNLIYELISGIGMDMEFHTAHLICSIIFLSLAVYYSLWILISVIERNLDYEPGKQPFFHVFKKELFKPVALGCLSSLIIIYPLLEGYGFNYTLYVIPVILTGIVIKDYFRIKKSIKGVSKISASDYFKLYLFSMITFGGISYFPNMLSGSYFGCFIAFVITIVPVAAGLWILTGNIIKRKVQKPWLVFVTYLLLLIPTYYMGLSITGILPWKVSVGHTNCESNLKNLGTAVEMFAVDNNGKLPGSLEDLTPEYLKEIPRCMNSLKKGSFAARHYQKLHGISTEGYKYEVSNRDKRYTVYCKGTTHSFFNYPENYPQYTSSEGLMRRPEKDSVN